MCRNKGYHPLLVDTFPKDIYPTMLQALSKSQEMTVNDSRDKGHGYHSLTSILLGAST